MQTGVTPVFWGGVSSAGGAIELAEWLLLPLLLHQVSGLTWTLHASMLALAAGSLSAAAAA